MVETQDEKQGCPWTVLPIKNNKYAKDLVEVHLSDRHLTGLEKFEDFPNLEVIWLNNNYVGPSYPQVLTLFLLFSYKTWTASVRTSV